MKTLITGAFIGLLCIMYPGTVQLQTNPPVVEKDLIAESGDVIVKVSVSSFSESGPCKAASSWRWGAKNHCPSTFVSAFEVRVNGESIFIPLSAFCDLGNPEALQIKPHTAAKNSFTVIVIGGDAGTSYEATLEFANNLLSERTVRHGEFPREAWEKTLYKFNM